MSGFANTSRRHYTRCLGCRLWFFWHILICDSAAPPGNTFRLLVGRWEVVYDNERVTTLTIFASGRVEFTDVFALGGSGIGEIVLASAEEIAEGFTHKLEGQYSSGRFEFVSLQNKRLVVRYWDGSAWHRGGGRHLVGGGCNLGERVRAFLETPDCEPDVRRCWRSGVVGDGPERGDAYLTILWEGRSTSQRTHASLVRRISTGERCLSASAVSTPSHKSQWGQHRDGAFNQLGPVLFGPDGKHSTCDEADAAVICLKSGSSSLVRHYYCPGTCHKLDLTRRAQLQCFSTKRTLPLLERYARWGWHGQAYQESVLHILLVRPDGVPRSQTPFFVEFGSMGLQDSNTQYLRALGWQGVWLDIMNADPSLNLHKQKMTPDNVLDVFQRHGVPKDVDFVSIDVDSCDLWILMKLTGPNSHFRPRVIQVEYNRHFGMQSSLTLNCSGGQAPWDHVSGSSEKPIVGGHFGLSAYGASLMAIARVADSRGYAVVWVERCFDAFLVRKDLMCDEGIARADLQHLAHRFSNYSVPGGGCKAVTPGIVDEALSFDGWWIADFELDRYSMF